MKLENVDDIYDLFTNSSFPDRGKKIPSIYVVQRQTDADAMGEREMHGQKSEHTLDGPNSVGDPTEHNSPLDIVGRAADDESTERERG